MATVAGHRVRRANDADSFDGVVGMVMVDEIAALKALVADLQALVAALESRAVTSVAPLAYGLARARRDVLPQPYLTNTGWEILLDLHLAERAGEQRIYPRVSERMMPSPETLVRYLGALEADEMISMTPLPDSQGSFAIALTPLGRSRIEKIFGAAVGPPPQAMAA